MMWHISDSERWFFLEKAGRHRKLIKASLPMRKRSNFLYLWGTCCPLLYLFCESLDPNKIWTSSECSKFCTLSACKTLSIQAPFPGSSFWTNTSGCVRPSSNYSIFSCFHCMNGALTGQTKGKQLGPSRRGGLFKLVHISCFCSCCD